jgi:hypothetical protein
MLHARSRARTHAQEKESPVVRKMIGYVLGFLVHYANTDPLDKENFYRIKDKILRRFGTPVGNDLQLLEGVRCNRCVNGRYWHWIYDSHCYGWEQCWQCSGTSWFKPRRYVLLKKYRLGRWYFHRPVSSFEDYKFKFVVPFFFRNKYIDGYIDHSNYYGWLSWECCLWLYLMFDIETFKRHIRPRPFSNVRTPLVFWLHYRWAMGCRELPYGYD